MDNKKVCVYCVVDEKYAHHIPFFLHFLEMSYPEYYALIAIKGFLPQTVSDMLYYIRNPKFAIQQNSFKDFPDDADILKTLRWVSYFPEMEEFDYIYVGDIDLWIMPEEPSLLSQHKKILKDHNTCYSNTDRIDPKATRGHRFTGLHFFKTKEYFKAMKPVMEKYYNILKTRKPLEFWNEKSHKMDNQFALRVMVEESGLPMPDHSFFSYHGLHLGHSRVLGRWESVFRMESDHKFYWKMFEQRMNTHRFWQFLKLTSHTVRFEIENMIKAGELYV